MGEFPKSIMTKLGENVKKIKKLWKINHLGVVKIPESFFILF